MCYNNGVTREWRNWQTRTFEGRVVRIVRVQFPSPAPNKNYYFDTVCIETVVLIFLLKALEKSTLFHFPA